MPITESLKSPCLEESVENLNFKFVSYTNVVKFSFAKLLVSNKMSAAIWESKKNLMCFGMCVKLWSGNLKFLNMENLFIALMSSDISSKSAWLKVAQPLR